MFGPGKMIWRRYFVRYGRSLRSRTKRQRALLALLTKSYVLPKVSDVCNGQDGEQIQPTAMTVVRNHTKSFCHTTAWKYFCVQSTQYILQDAGSMRYFVLII